LQYQVIISFLSVGLYYVVQPSEHVLNGICLALILLFGIPHGALDHKIDQTVNKGRSLKKFVLIYLAVSMGYVLWWVIVPYKALILFIILSAYHFGQEFLESIKIHPGAISSFLMGLVILINPMLLHYEQVSAYIITLTGEGLPALTWSARYSSILIITSLTLVWVSYREQISKNEFYRLTGFSLFILILNGVVSSFLFAFTVYFLVFHSWNAFTHAYYRLKTFNSQFNFRKFVSGTFLFAIISILGIVLLLWFFDPKNTDQLIIYFFAMVSVITLPHTIVFDQLYKARRY